MTATVTTGRGSWLRESGIGFPKADGCLNPSSMSACLRSPGAYEGDLAYASAVRASLVSARAVEVRSVGQRDLEYRRATWTDWPDPGPGSEAYNAQLRRDHEARERGLREQDKLRAQQLADSPLGQQRQQILDLIDWRVDERVREWLTSLDGDSVSRMRSRLNGVAMAAPTEDERPAKAGQEGRTNA